MLKKDIFALSVLWCEDPHVTRMCWSFSSCRPSSWQQWGQSAGCGCQHDSWPEVTLSKSAGSLAQPLGAKCREKQVVTLGDLDLGPTKHHTDCSIC